MMRVPEDNIEDEQEEVPTRAGSAEKSGSQASKPESMRESRPGRTAKAKAAENLVSS